MKADFDQRKGIPFLTVPIVDPADLKSVWQMQEELRARHDSGFAVAIDLYKGACSRRCLERLVSLFAV